MSSFVQGISARSLCGPAVATPTLASHLSPRCASPSPPSFVGRVCIFPCPGSFPRCFAESTPMMCAFPSLPPVVGNQVDYSCIGAGEKLSMEEPSLRCLRPRGLRLRGTNLLCAQPNSSCRACPTLQLIPCPEVLWVTVNFSSFPEASLQVIPTTLQSRSGQC